jgi:hypothetical protein
VSQPARFVGDSISTHRSRLWVPENKIQGVIALKRTGEQSKPNRL